MTSVGESSLPVSMSGDRSTSVDLTSSVASTASVATTASMTAPGLLPVAWFAGVIDARAHIEAHNRHGHVQPRVRVTTKKLELLYRLADLTGNSVVQDNRGYSRRPCGDHCDVPHSHIVRQSAQWTVDSSRATIVLFNTLPHMFAQRAEARLALDAGLAVYPPARGDVPKQMLALGWQLPR